MKIILFSTIYAAMSVTSAIQQVASSVSKHLLAEKGSGADAFLQLVGNSANKNRAMKGCRDNYVCPPYSFRKPNRRCYDDMEDCECELGFFHKGEACIAKKDRCTQAMADQVEGEVDMVYHWMGLAQDTSIDKATQIGYLYRTNDALELAWEDYNRAMASCEMYLGFDVEAEGGLGGPDRRDRRLAAERRLFGRLFRRIGRAIVKVAKAVVRAVVAVVELAIDVVRELVECGVGIIADGPKCGLIGCAFGLVGVGLNIAFAVATGGASKVAAGLCSLTEDVDDDSERDSKTKKSETIVNVLQGIGDTICTVSEKVSSPVLASVCEISQISESQSEAGRVENVIGQVIGNPVVLRFVSALREAICGNPGSAILDLLEEVVVCEIDCAADNNVFCPAGDPEPIFIPIVPVPPPLVVEYEARPGNACRTESGGLGRQGSDYTLLGNIEKEEDCEQLCNKLDEDCVAFEYNNGSDRCELWKIKPARFQEDPNFVCHVKIDF